MAFLLRQIRTNRWAAASEYWEWLKKDEILADPMADFVTVNGKLSLFQINDDMSNFNRVVAALAANRDKPANFDYILIEKSILKAQGFILDATPGDTADEEVNQAHVDLVQLSTQKVELLTRIFFYDHHERNRVNKSSVEDFIKLYISEFDTNKLNSKIKTYFDLDS